MLQRQEGAVGTLQGTNALLIVRTMFVPPVRCCFSKTSFISKSKRSVNQRQDSDVCTAPTANKTDPVFKKCSVLCLASLPQLTAGCKERPAPT